MYIWKCKYCHEIFHYCELCVNHELKVCLKNPKQKYKIDNEKYK